MSANEWEGEGQSDAERVDPSELDDVPAGTAEEAGTGGGWTEGGGTLGPETEGAPGTEEVGGWTESGAGAEDVPGGDTAGASELRERAGDEERL